MLVSQPVHQHAYETAVAAQAGGYLRYFVTALYDTGRGLADPRLRAWLPPRTRRRIQRQLGRRRHPQLDPARVLTIPRYQLIAAGLGRAVRLRSRQRLGLERWAHDRFDQELGRRLARLRGVELVHAFEGSALATLEAARSAGKATILDVPSAHERFMELEGRPARQRVLRERLLADLLLAPSDYVVGCLLEAGVPGERILKIPYGVDPVIFQREAKPRADGVFRVVFVGGIGRRKGVASLLEAWRRLALPGAELLLVGAPDDEGRRLLRRYTGHFRFVGPWPKQEVHRFFRQSDLLVLPSLAEGSALVTYEALACGLPVVTTPNSGSVVRDGVDGLLVAPGDVDGLCERIRHLHDHPDLRRGMGAAGRELILRHYTWRHYQQRIGAAYQALLGGHKPRRQPGPAAVAPVGKAAGGAG